jgi:hypothetical protein
MIYMLIKKNTWEYHTISKRTTTLMLWMWKCYTLWNYKVTAKKVENKTYLFQRNYGVATPDVLARKSEEGPLLYCRIRAESEDNSQLGPLVGTPGRQLTTQCKYSRFTSLFIHIIFMSIQALRNTHHNSCCHSQINTNITVTTPTCLVLYGNILISILDNQNLSVYSVVIWERWWWPEDAFITQNMPLQMNWIQDIKWNSSA